MIYGIYGGTFDPPHNGHLKVAVNAIKELKLDKLFIVPANHSPLKTRSDISSPQDTLAMCNLTFQEDKMSVLDIEIERQGESYTYDTILEIQNKYPGDYWLVIGGDILSSLTRWHRINEIAELVHFFVQFRNVSDYKELELLPENIKKKIKWKMPNATHSSTQIREYAKLGKTFKNLLPESVQSYILEHELYK